VNNHALTAFLAEHVMKWEIIENDNGLYYSSNNGKSFSNLSLWCPVEDLNVCRGVELKLGEDRDNRIRYLGKMIHHHKAFNILTPTAQQRCQAIHAVLTEGEE